MRAVFLSVCALAALALSFAPKATADEPIAQRMYWVGVTYTVPTDDPCVVASGSVDVYTFFTVGQEELQPGWPTAPLLSGLGVGFYDQCEQRWIRILRPHADRELAPEEFSINPLGEATASLSATEPMGVWDSVESDFATYNLSWTSDGMSGLATVTGTITTSTYTVHLDDTPARFYKCMYLGVSPGCVGTSPY